MGDFTLPLHSVGLISPQVQLTEGQVLVGNGTIVVCVACKAGDQVAVEVGGAILFKYAEIEAAVDVQGTTVVSHSFADPSSSYIIPPGFGGQLLEVELSSPANGSTVTRGAGSAPVPVLGTLVAYSTGMKPSRSFPVAFVAQQQGCITGASGIWDVIRAVSGPVSPGGDLIPGGW